MNDASNSRDDPGARSPGVRPVLLVIVVAAAAFLPGLAGEFVFDDHRFVEKNEAITSLDNVSRILVDPRTSAPNSWEGIFRPLRTLSFAVDHALWGLRPLGYHVQSLLWHVLASVMLLLLLVRLGFGKAPSTIATLIFAAHPAQAESVVWITSRGDVMSGALVLLAMCVHAGGDGRGRVRGLVVAGVGLLAMLAKEVAIVLPALVILLDVVLRRPWRAPAPTAGGDRRPILAYGLRAWGPLVAAALLYFGFRQWRMAVHSELLDFGHMTHWWGGTYLTQLCVAAHGLILHVGTLLMPIGSRLDFYPPADGRIDPPVLLAGLVLVGILVLVVWSWRSRPGITAGLLWFLLTLLPVSNVFFTVGIASADRFLYLPLAGIALAAVPALRRIPLAASAALVVLLVALSLSASGRFRNDVTLWADAPQDSPRRLSFRAEQAYLDVVALWDEGRQDEARARIPDALALAHAANARWRSMMGIEGQSRPEICTGIADLKRRLGLRRETFRYLREAVDAEPDHAGVRRVTALFLQDLGDPERALPALRQARDLGFEGSLDEAIGRLLLEIASWHKNAARYGRAMLRLEESLLEWPEVEGNLSARPALEVFRAEKARVLAAPRPAEDDLQGWLRAGVLLGQWGEWARAIDLLSDLRRALPGHPQVLEALARWGYEEGGDIAQAGRLWLELLALDPESEEARLGVVRCGAFHRDEALAADPTRRLELLEGLPDRPLILLERARGLRQLWRDEEAHECLVLAARGRGPGVIDALRLLWEEDPGDG